MIKSKKLAFPLFMVFLGILFISLLHVDEGKISAADNNQVQHVQVRVYEKNVISTDTGYPVYNILFVKQNNESFDYSGGSSYINTYYPGNHRGNAMSIYTKVITDNNYTLDIDNNGNIVALDGVGV
jgi:hypothetical protein